MAAFALEASEFVDCTESEPVEFLIGVSGRSFKVPKGFIARLSPALDTMVNGPFKEGIQKRVSWPDVSVETFQRFVQFAYGGTYSDEDIGIKHIHGRISTQGQSPTEQEPWHPSPRASTHQNKRRRLFNKEENSNIIDEQREKSVDSLPCSLMDFCKRWVKIQDDDPWNFAAPRPITYRSTRYIQYEIKYEVTMRFCRFFSEDEGSSVDEMQARNRHQAKEPSHSALSNNAEVYILADKYGVLELCDMSLHRIHSHLQDYVVCEESMADLVHLVRLLYGGTTRGNRARRLISMYFGCFVELVIDTSELDAAVDDVADFGFDILKACTTRLKPER
ncbi:hypothetical protein FDECE_13043 [Fusarium decemcellulare]|nr:hypothetical protein FDECE_13043 [Fusarium decemcellulare]